MNELSSASRPGSTLPVVFSNCVGWFHPTPSGRAGGTAALLCAGASQDFSNGYRPFRLLANHLAEAGYPALRFDYPGTGDSADPDCANLWEAWQESITVAAAWLRTQTGAEHLVLVGLRIGATLAAMAAAKRNDVAGLALIEPCLNGRSYVSQLVTEARLRGSQQSDGGIEVGELMFTPACLDLMRAADLTLLPVPPSRPVAVFSRTPQEKIASRLAGWRQQDIKLSCDDLGGLEAMLRPSQHSGEPELDAAPLLEWLRREMPPQADQLPAVPHPPKTAGLSLPGCTESPLRFGTALHLVGVLCRPALDRAPGFAVVICNAGGNPRHGFARFGVECARVLSEAGIASLRFDFSGLGDSIHRRDGADLQTDVFTEDRVRDIRDALDALEVLGFRGFALHGLCSGAYHAVRGACADARINVLLAVNLPWFSLRHERPGPDSFAQKCVNTLVSRNTMALFIFGENDAGLKSFERHFGAVDGLLPAQSGLRVSIVPGLDHELTFGWMRRRVAEQIIQFLLDTQAVPSRDVHPLGDMTPKP